MSIGYMVERWSYFVKFVPCSFHAADINSNGHAYDGTSNGDAYDNYSVGHAYNAAPNSCSNS